MGYLAGAEKFYDLFGDKDDVDFYLELARRHPGKALELGVGTARLAIPLARAGVDTWGIDNSRHMLEAAAKNIERETEETRRRLHMVPADAVDFELEERFSLIYFPSGSFDHITEPGDQLRALGNVRRHLAPGGVYAFDLYLRHQLKAERDWFVQRKETGPNTKVVRTGYWRVTPERRLMDLDMWYERFVDGAMVERYHEGSTVYIHDLGRVHEMLEEAGLRLVAEYSDHHWTPYGGGEHVLILAEAS